MNVGAFVIRALVVDDVGDVLNVDAAGSDIGGNQNIGLAGAEVLQSTLARLLVEVTVQRAGIKTTVRELFGQTVGSALRLGEDDGAAATLRLQYTTDELGLVHSVGTVGELLDVRRLFVRRLFVRCPNVSGLVHVAASHCHNRTRHGCREQHRLAPSRQSGDDPLNIRQEAQVEHFVGLVEDDGRDFAELENPTAVQVEQTARSSDDDIGAGLERFNLRFVVPTAVDRDDLDLQLFCRGRKFAGNLLGEFARWCDDEPTRGASGFGDFGG